MSSPWSRVDAWLAAHAPSILAELRPPATDAALEKLAAVAGSTLHPGLVAMYRAHDGTHQEASAILAAVRTPNDAQWARYMRWLSTDAAARQLEIMKDLGEWPAELVPFALDAGGNMLVVDLSSGEVAAWDHETAETIRLATDMDAWIADLAEDMKNKLVAAPNEDPDDEAFDDGRLMLLAAPPPPVAIAAPPALAADRTARIMVEVLQERRFVELKKRADVEHLVRALHEALAIEDADDRKDRVIEILEESPAVDEIFASDDKLTALVDELS